MSKPFWVAERGANCGPYYAKDGIQYTRDIDAAKQFASKDRCVAWIRLHRDRRQLTATEHLVLPARTERVVNSRP